MPAKYRSLGHLYHGHIYFLRGRPEDALQSVARSIELDSTNVEAHWLRGRALLALKREDDLHDELAQLEQAVTAKGGLKYRWFIYHLQGEMALQGGDFERAVDSFENALQLAPRDRSFYLSALAGAYAKSGQIQNALSQYDAALEFNPNNAMAHFEVANIYKRNGRLSDAVEAYKRVVEILAGADEENYQLLTARKEI